MIGEGLANNRTYPFSEKYTPPAFLTQYLVQNIHILKGTTDVTIFYQAAGKDVPQA